MNLPRKTGNPEPDGSRHAPDAATGNRAAGGAGSAFASVRSSLARHLEARIRLFALESRDAAGRGLWFIVHIGLALFVLGCGYALLLVGIVLALCSGLAMPLWVSALVLAAAHGAVGLWPVTRARALHRGGGALFARSREELQKDRQWIDSDR